MYTHAHHRELLSDVERAVGGTGSATPTPVDSRGWPTIWTEAGEAGRLGPTRQEPHSLGVDLLGLLVQRSAPLDRNEACQTKRLLGLLHGHGPALDASIRLLALRVGLLGHDLPILVLHKIALGKARAGLLLVAAEDGSPSALTLRDFRHLHGLLLLHGLLRGLGLHGRLRRLGLHRLGLHGLHDLLAGRLHGLRGALAFIAAAFMAFMTFLPAAFMAFAFIAFMARTIA